MRSRPRRRAWRRPPPTPLPPRPPWPWTPVRARSPKPSRNQSISSTPPVRRWPSASSRSGWSSSSCSCCCAVTGEVTDDADRIAVARLLGREPEGAFEVVVRDAAGEPVVIRNSPLLADGRPMPTRYWLVGRREVLAVSRLEAAGGVRRAEAEVDAGAVADAHGRYAAERDAAMPPSWSGPGPS